MFPPDTRILVVDDMPTIRDLVKNQLRSLGYKDMIEAKDGAEALETLKNNLTENKPIGLVISDWNMPNMTGLEFLKKVRGANVWANLPFVLLTSEAERDQVTEAVLAGASQYIVKPFTGKIFEEKLRGVWAKHSTAK